MGNLFEEHGRELLNLGPEFHMAEWECLDAEKMLVCDPGERIRLTFRKAPLLADGEVAWKYASRERIRVTFTILDHRLWVRAWEKRTGKCAGCAEGRPGETWTGWSVSEGHRFAPCSRCGGTGLSWEVANG